MGLVGSPDEVSDQFASMRGSRHRRTCARSALTCGSAAIALEECFALQLRETRVMLRGMRRRLAGVVVNRHPNLARDEFDVLKAIPTRCIRHGLASRNRASHLDSAHTRLDASPMQARRLRGTGAASARKPPHRRRRARAGEGKCAPDRKSPRT
ncbi:hypothetical protein BDI4_1570001 [Burkholderia diffusa]|nr:hypothetical protein BDI4_1570001 [Burkholderia diffusa]